MSTSNEYDNKLKICKNYGYKIAPSNNSNNFNDIDQNYKSICIYENSQISYYNKIIDNSKLYKIDSNVNNSNTSNLEDTSLNTKNIEQNKNINRDNKKSNENKNTKYANGKSIQKRKPKESKKLKSATRKHKHKK